MRVLLPFLILFALGADEVVPFRLEYQGGNLALAAGALNDLTGGVHAWYGGAHLFADRVQWVQSAIGDGKRVWLERLEVLSGPAGPDPDRVLLDSTEAVLDGLGFHGRLRPRSMIAVRGDPDPGLPDLVTWQVVLEQPGWFSGDLNLEGGWVPHGGWADRIVVDLTARGDGGAMKCRAIHLHGRPATANGPAQRCRLDRLRTAVHPAEALANQSPTAAEFAIEGAIISIHFSANGTFDSLTPSGATTMYGSPPRGLTLRSRSGLGADGTP